MFFCLEGFGLYGPDPKTVTGLIARLAVEDEDERHYAARRLGELGSVAEIALPSLRETLDGDDEQLSEACRDAIRRIEDSIQSGDSVQSTSRSKY